ncbi:ABC transporter ATP-binding protein [soil metagenome]
MSETVISVENISKQYRLGEIGTGTLSHDFNRWWHKVRGKEDPYLKVGEVNDRTVKGNSDYVWALKDISFDVKRGEVLGIIGRNGAGKSTLLKILSRVTTPTSGQIKVKGRIASLLEVGTGFNPDLTGRENIYLNGSILGMRKTEIDKKFDEIVAFAEVDRYIDTPVKRYSSGMYVRLAFAVAAHLEPEILIVDEVLAVGDAEFQNKCLGKIKDISNLENRTVLFVTHQLGMIQHLCHRVLWMKEGTLLEDGNTQAVIQHYIASTKEMAKTGLSKRIDRQGKGEITITAIGLFDSDGTELSDAISGRELLIRLYFQAHGNRVFKNCRASIAVTKDLRVYFLLSTELVDKVPLHLSGDGYLEFVLPKLPLSDDVYELTCYIESSGETQDWVENAYEMKVLDGDFFGTQKDLPVGWKGNSVLVDHEWRLGSGSNIPDTGSAAALLG